MPKSLAKQIFKISHPGSLLISKKADIETGKGVYNDVSNQS
jgi:hypothetical protein